MKISQLPAAIRIKAREIKANCKLRSYNKSTDICHIVWLVEYSRGITLGWLV
jgi:hypothetical protein